MVNPVPGYSISTPYGRRGSYWSCDRDANGNGIHTGNDYAAPSGTKAVAARPGTVVYVNHGSAFGYHQIEVKNADGTADFYAHLRSRVPSGTKVQAGDKVGEVGAEGNVTGPHLHFEKHKAGHTGWSCSAMVDPTPSHNYQPSSGSGGSGSSGGGGKDDDMPTRGKAQQTKAVKLKAGQWVAVTWNKINAGDALFRQGEYGILVGGKMIVATLAVRVTGRGKGGNVRVSWTELADGDLQETMQQANHGEFDYAVDTRAGYVPKDQVLRARVQCDTDATLESATVEVLAW